MKSPDGSAARWRTAIAALLAALVPVLVFWRGALLRGVFFQADLVVYYLPAYIYATRVLRTGVVPLWAPEMEGGQPFHAQWEPTFLYPVVVPFRFLLPPWWALNLLLLFHYALAAVGMFAYARRLSLSRSAALVSAAVYAVNGFMIAHLEHPNLIVGAAWLPWLLLAVESGLSGRFLASGLGMAIVLAMMLLGGHPDMFLMGALVAGLLVLLHPVHGVLRKRRPTDALPALLLLFAGYGLGIALAAAQMLPTLDLARLSWQHRSASPGFQDDWSLRPEQFLVQLLPDLFGRNGQDTFWGRSHYWEVCTYVGAAALALAVVGLFSRHRLARFYGGLAVLAAWLAMGTNSLAFSILRQFPAFGTMRLPCRYMFLFDLSAALLAGMGAHWLARLQRPEERARARWVYRLTAAVLGLTGLWLLGWWRHLPQLIEQIRPRLATPEHFHRITNVAPLLRRFTGQLRLDVALLMGGLAFVTLLLWAGGRQRALQRAIPSLAFVAVVATLFLFGSGYHTVIPAQWIEASPFTVTAIRSSAPVGPFRVLAWDSITLHADVAVHRGWWPTDEHGYRQYIASLPGNYNLVWGLSSVRQEEWSALPLPYTTRLTKAILAGGGRSGFASMEPYLRWLNTGFVISRQPLRDPSLAPVAEDLIHLYRTHDPGRRVWIVHHATVAPDDARLLQQLTSNPTGLMSRVALSGDAGQQPGARSEISSLPFGAVVSRLPSGVSEGARIVTRSPTRLTVETTAARAGYLVVGESWAPGWRAWMDSAPAPVLRANFIHRAVALPAGHHRVVFNYLPTSFRLGLYLSAAALATLLALATAGLGRAMK